MPIVDVITDVPWPDFVIVAYLLTSALPEIE